MWVDDSVEHRDKEQDEKRVDHLHLVRFDEGVSQFARGLASLCGPPGSGLVKQSPEKGDGDEDLQDFHEFLGVVNQVLAVLGLGMVQPVFLFLCFAEQTLDLSDQSELQRDITMVSI